MANAAVRGVERTYPHQCGLQRTTEQLQLGQARGLRLGGPTCVGIPIRTNRAPVFALTSVYSGVGFSTADSAGFGARAQ